MRTKRMASIVALTLAAAFALGACSEKSQDAPLKSGKYQGKPDTRPWEGEPVAFDAGGYKRGDKASWESALKVRADAQNEYVRIK